MSTMTKRQILERALDQGLTKILVFTKIAGVALPQHLMEEDECMLNLSYKFRRRIELTDHQLEADLSFNKKIFPIVIPWESIIRMIDANGDHHVFRTDIDTIVQEAFNSGNKPVPDQEGEVILDRTAGLQLTLIQGGGQLTPPRSGHLSLLKN